MAVAIPSIDTSALAERVSALNDEIAAFYERHGNAVRVTGHCNYRTDMDDPYFRVTIEVTEIVARIG